MEYRVEATGKRKCRSLGHYGPSWATQKPVGIGLLVLQDLKNARTIVKWVAWAEPQYNFGPVMDEWCNEVPKELDFNSEAGHSLD